MNFIIKMFKKIIFPLILINKIKINMIIIMKKIMKIIILKKITPISSSPIIRIIILTKKINIIFQIIVNINIILMN